MDVFNDLGKYNNGLVAYDKLQETLISTAKFYADHTVLMIEHMEKIGENRRDSLIFQTLQLPKTSEFNPLKVYTRYCSVCSNSPIFYQTKMSEEKLWEY